MFKQVDKITPVISPAQFDKPQIPELGILDAEVDDLVRTIIARNTFKVSGKGYTVAVLDTGLRTTHVDFKGRVPKQLNFTQDNNGDPNDALDGNGHGTNVGGIIVANGIHKGIAPGANIIPIKVLSNSGGGNFASVAKALDWILENHTKYNITTVCMSLGDSGNYRSEGELTNQGVLRNRIQLLRTKRIAVAIASGNDFFSHNSQQGMSYPAIIRECISVGAVYDANEGSFTYPSSGATAYSTDKDRITPFSQRLHPTISLSNSTTIFAPGAPVTSSGIDNDKGESIQHGTSQATPVTVGAIILIQELYQRHFKILPTIKEIESFLKRGAVTINDGDDEKDNVDNTGLDFPRLDIVGSLNSIIKSIRYSTFVQQKFNLPITNSNSSIINEG
ncbi:S8 family peptidase [Flexithrix dorotheae]|uniref:S8 family peptidase n=1 Tax=Flexithrix dorotheae TaxID=70993 RepID=UPI000372CA78|nr:S8 family serine peptidase [Flexithrix dorotheae]